MLYVISLMAFAFVTFKTTYDAFIVLHIYKDTTEPHTRNLSRLDGTLCQNTDYFPQHKKAIYTMLADDKNYVLSALKIAHTLRLHTTDEHFDMVVMELVSKPLGVAAWVCLEKMGWKRCVVDRINPFDEVGIQKRYPRFVDLLTKVHVWGMTMYETLVFLDADTLVLRSIRHLLRLKLSHHKIAASAEMTSNGGFEGFNTGVFVIHPDRHEYERLLSLQQDPSVHFDISWADQGFLNFVYKDKWRDLGFTNNALVWVSWQNHAYWLHHYADINIIHFTGVKPWSCFFDNFIERLIIPSAYYTTVCKVWSDTPRRLVLMHNDSTKNYVFRKKNITKHLHHRRQAPTAVRNGSRSPPHPHTNVFLYRPTISTNTCVRSI